MIETISPVQTIADQAFTHMGLREIGTPNGNTLTCFVLQDMVMIRDADEECLGFSAGAASKELPLGNQESDSAPGRLMSFGVRTVRQERGWFTKTKRHPDLHARALFDSAVQYFDNQEAPLTHLQGLWINDAECGTTNYKAFYRALRGIQRPTEEQLQSAAFSTWTGRQALRHGFSTIPKLEVDADADKVTVYFARKPVTGLFRQPLADPRQ